MSDTRPTPEYGEYATPEEQAAAIGTVPEAMQDITPQATPHAAVETPSSTLAPARRWDVIATVALVVFGAYVTFSSIPQYADLQATIEQVFAGYGYTGTYANPSLAHGVGIALNIVQPIGLLIAVVFSARRLRSGRISFWIPLSTGIIVGIVSLALMAVVFLSDPSFMAFFEKSMGVAN